MTLASQFAKALRLFILGFLISSQSVGVQAQDQSELERTLEAALEDMDENDDISFIFSWSHEDGENIQLLEKSETKTLLNLLDKEQDKKEAKPKRMKPRPLAQKIYRLMVTNPIASFSFISVLGGMVYGLKQWFHIATPQVAVVPPETHPVERTIRPTADNSRPGDILPKPFFDIPSGRFLMGGNQGSMASVSYSSSSSSSSSSSGMRNSQSLPSLKYTFKQAQDEAGLESRPNTPESDLDTQPTVQQRSTQTEKRAQLQKALNAFKTMRAAYKKDRLKITEQVIQQTTQALLLAKVDLQNCNSLDPDEKVLIKKSENFLNHEL